MRPRLPRRGVLFICAHNSARSPMAEAIGRRRAKGTRIHVASAGLDPAGRLHAFAEEVLREEGLRLPEHTPRALSDVPDEEWERIDLIVSLVPPEVLEGVPLPRRETLYWRTEDPTLVTGDLRRDVLLDRFRDVRDQIARRIEQLATRGHESFGPPGMREC